MKPETTNADVAAQIKALLAMPEAEIDVADIPEAAEEKWIFATRPALYKPRKRPVTLRLDADIVAWFKDRAQAHGYQTEINAVLRRHIATFQS
jgi:uncharacterized protein (DUF4415 family)